ADGWRPAPGGAAPGPPFRTADSQLLEVEAPSPGAWRGFWERLGAAAESADAAWPAFALRYNTATCLVPEALPAAIGSHRLEEILAAAAATGVSTCRVRTYDEVLHDHRWKQPLWFDDFVPGAPTPLHRATAAGSRPGPVPAPVAHLPLAGLRVLECTHGLPGPLAGHLLGALGAEVTRIEAPGGDPGRRVRPLAGGTGAGFLTPDPPTSDRS
ncbi:MAG: CoA transferase, partial [Steroidobacteraceae bacterium]